MNLGVDALNLAADRRGMGRVVRQTLTDLRALGASPTLIVNDFAHMRPLADEFGLPVIDTFAVRRNRFDRVWYPWNAMRFSPYAESIVTIHDPFAFTFPAKSFVARWREQTPVRRAIARADRIHAVSQWTAGELARLFPQTASRIETIPNAISEYWSPVESATADPYFFFLGGADERKNAAMLFRAFDTAFAAGGARLITGGALSQADGAVFAAMRAPHERLNPDDDELRALYSGALAVLVPSLGEGFGLPALEAMACGAPVIASNAAALPETCGDAAILLDPRDERSWSVTLVAVANDATLRAQLRERGLARAATARHDRLARALLAR